MNRRNAGLERAEEARRRIQSRTAEVAQKMRESRLAKETSVISHHAPTEKVQVMSLEETKIILNGVLSSKNRTPVSSDLSEYFHSIPRILTNNGSSVSMQAGAGNYSHPRAAAERYDSVELGFFETKSPLASEFRDYFDGDDEHYPEGGVFGYVPMDLVAQWVIDNGGLAMNEIDPKLISPITNSQNEDFGTW